MRGVLAGLLLTLCFPAAADERILEFQSDIVVMQDGWIEVTETIRVVAQGNRIRRGIYRDFPTTYFDRLGNRYQIDFDVLSVTRNGLNEDYHITSIRDGSRIYFGSADRLIAEGEHTYALRYRASRMLGFFDTHDELYWNVTGFDWAFPIDRASATVHLMFDVPTDAIVTDAYTGGFGAVGKDFRASVDGSGRAQFVANNPLSPVSGLTIVVGWPKGFVAQPSGWQKFVWLLQDNLNLLLALGGLGALLAYYIPVWRRYGKDPDEGVVIPRYEPPEGYSPASLRYVRQMYYDDKVMTSAIMNLAVKGYLRIEVDAGSDGFLGLIGKEDPTWSLKRLNPVKNKKPLAVGEKELYEGLFDSGTTVELKNENHSVLGRAKSRHRKSLVNDYKKHYFRTNTALNIPGIVILAVAAVAALSQGPSPAVFIVLAAALVTTVVFASIMKAPTARGRALLDSMLGFKDYLEVAEKDELNLRNPPEKTPELFETMLPFALALGVDQQWSEKFAALMASLRDSNGNSWQPTWYNGHWNGVNFSTATQSLSSSLGGAVSSSVRPPGSSSGGGGGGGGGFSGGGGGGGGGGGW